MRLYLPMRTNELVWGSCNKDGTYVAVGWMNQWKATNSWTNLELNWWPKKKNILRNKAQKKPTCEKTIHMDKNRHYEQATSSLLHNTERLHQEVPRHNKISRKIGEADNAPIPTSNQNWCTWGNVEFSGRADGENVVCGTVWCGSVHGWRAILIIMHASIGTSWFHRSCIHAKLGSGATEDITPRYRWQVWSIFFLPQSALEGPTSWML
jgi:hypothetical protein